MGNLEIAAEQLDVQVCGPQMNINVILVAQGTFFYTRWCSCPARGTDTSFPLRSLYRLSQCSPPS